MKRVVSVNAVSSTVQIVTEGHPTECVEKAHEVAEVILGDRRWAFISLEFQSPLQREFGWNRDSEWRLIATAVHKPLSVA